MNTTLSLKLSALTYRGLLAAGTPRARAACGFLALCWSVRFVAGTFVFDLRPYLTNRWRRAGYTATNIVFTCLPIVYGWVALKGVNL